MIPYNLSIAILSANNHAEACASALALCSEGNAVSRSVALAIARDDLANAKAAIAWADEIIRTRARRAKKGARR